jgi:hypothetical protein
MNDLNILLCARHHTKCTQTKKNRVCTEKYKYWKCCCGCSYRITLTHEDDMIMFKGTVILPNHDTTGDLQHTSSIHLTDEVHQQIDCLVQGHLFEPNYGAKKVCS